MMNSAAAQRLGFPLSADCAPALTAARMEAVLMPPRPAMKTSRLRELSISRRTSRKKDISYSDSAWLLRNCDYAAVIGLGRRSRQRSFALLPPAPLDPPRRAGHYQDKQHDGRRDEDRDQERAEEAGAPLTAC